MTNLHLNKQKLMYFLIKLRKSIKISLKKIVKTKSEIDPVAFNSLCFSHLSINLIPYFGLLKHNFRINFIRNI